MALINCSECSKEISDKAAVCPYCGCPVQTNNLPDKVNCLECKQFIPFNDDVCPNCGLFNSQKHNILAALNTNTPQNINSYGGLFSSQPTSPANSITHSSDPVVIPASDTKIICPKCRSINTASAGTKGFGLGKAAVGGLLLGPVGLLGGLVGSKKLVVSCIKCGHKWSP